MPSRSERRRALRLIPSEDEYRFVSLRINVSDLVDVVDYIKTIPPVKKVEVRQMLGGPGRGPEVNLAAPARASLRHVRIEAFDASQTAVMYVDLGRETQAWARLTGAARRIDGGGMPELELQSLRDGLDTTTARLADFGWKPPSAFARWTAAMVGSAVLGLGLLVWAATLLVLQNLSTQFNVQTMIILTLIVGAVVALSIAALRRCRALAVSQDGRILIGVETRSGRRVLLHGILISIIAGAVGAFIGALAG